MAGTFHRSVMRFFDLEWWRLVADPFSLTVIVGAKGIEG